MNENIGTESDSEHKPKDCARGDYSSLSGSLMHNVQMLIVIIIYIMQYLVQ